MELIDKKEGKKCSNIMYLSDYGAEEFSWNMCKH